MERRNITSFEAEHDVNRMLNRCRSKGKKLGKICNEALRKYLVENGFAGKRDLKDGCECSSHKPQSTN